MILGFIKLSGEFQVTPALPIYLVTIVWERLSKWLDLNAWFSIIP